MNSIFVKSFFSFFFFNFWFCFSFLYGKLKAQQQQQQNQPCLWMISFFLDKMFSYTYFRCCGRGWRIDNRELNKHTTVPTQTTAITRRSFSLLLFVPENANNINHEFKKKMKIKKKKETEQNWGTIQTSYSCLNFRLFPPSRLTDCGQYDGSHAESRQIKQFHLSQMEFLSNRDELAWRRGFTL